MEGDDQKEKETQDNEDDSTIGEREDEDELDSQVASRTPAASSSTANLSCNKISPRTSISQEHKVHLSNKRNGKREIQPDRDKSTPKKSSRQSDTDPGTSFPC